VRGVVHQPVVAGFLEMAKRNSRFGEWMGRATLVVLGLVITAIGVIALQQGIWWEKSLNARFGRFGIRPTLDWIVLGVIFTTAGFIPWNRISDWLEKRDANKRRH
jgi:fucose 4-O-acetylase-like acetyltransferase